MQILKIARNECHQLLQQNKIKVLEMHPEKFEEDLDELNVLKIKVQGFMSKKDESIEHIEEWSCECKAKVQENDAPIEELQHNKKTERKKE